MRSKGFKHSQETKDKIRNSKLGSRASAETKNKMSLARKGRKLSKGWCKNISDGQRGRVAGMAGKKHTLETRRKIAEALKGEKSSFWKGGVTPLNAKIRVSMEYRDWRTKVFERDNYTCVWCGARGNLNADHIKPFSLFPKLRFKLDNGRTLCVPCHRKTATFARNIPKASHLTHVSKHR